MRHAIFYALLDSHLNQYLLSYDCSASSGKNDDDAKSVWQFAPVFCSIKSSQWSVSSASGGSDLSRKKLQPIRFWSGRICFTRKTASTEITCQPRIHQVSLFTDVLCSQNPGDREVVVLLEFSSRFSTRGTQYGSCLHSNTSASGFHKMLHLIVEGCGHSVRDPVPMCCERF